MLNIIASGIVVLVTHALEAITGFGCTVLALPFLTSLLGMKTGVMCATTLAWILAWYIIITKRKDIVWKQAALIIGCMLFGLPIGMHLFKSGDAATMKFALSLFIIVVSLWQLIKLVWLKPRNTEQPEGWKAVPYYLLLVCGGIIHGMFSSGGPLVVLYASKALPEKNNFRATLCTVWATLNTIILASYFSPDSGYSTTTATTTIALLPFLALGIIAGEKVHDKVNAKVFSLIVFSMLFLTGIIMIITR